MDILTLRRALAPKYYIERVIGSGGMATVYQARRESDRGTVAVKVLSADASAAVGRRRFQREIQVVSKLEHPNILPILDSGELPDALYYVMPFIAGESMRARLERQQQLDLDEAIHIGEQVASALDFAHRQGIVHRDIKPENILLDGKKAIVADFGIARAMQPSDDDRVTQTGITLGTPAYMSPEQARADKKMDGRADIYSLGCCLFESIAGMQPFSGPTAQVIIARHTLEQAPPLRIARGTVPLHVEAAILRAMSKAAADRFATAADFADALTGRKPVAMPGGSAPTPRGIRSRRGRLAATLAGVATVAWFGWRLGFARSEETPTVSALDPRRIAVRYFSDESGGSLGYLADGLTEALIDRLSTVSTLDVISANGVRPFESTTPSDSVAWTLGSGTVVEGTVSQLSGDSVRIRVRLMEGASGNEFRQASFTGSLVNALQLRDGVADSAASFLRSRLGDEIRVRSRRAETRSGAAWGLVQQAERMKKMAEEFAAVDSMVAMDRALLLADSMLTAAEALDRRWTVPIVLRGQIAYRRSRLEEDRTRMTGWITTGLDHAARALRLEARDADALELRGTLRYVAWLQSLEDDSAKASALLRDAEADLRSAVAASPTNASAWSVLSHLHYQKPDFTEAKLAAQRAYEQDAYLSAAPDIVWRLYTTSYDLEDFPGAVRWCAEGWGRFRTNPRFVECRLWLMTTREVAADVPRAWALLDSSRALAPNEEWESKRRELQMVVAGVIARSAAAVDSGARRVLVDSARRVVERSRAPAGVDPEGELLGTEAFIQTLLNDKDAALELLSRYFALNPAHRALFAKGNSWWWRPLRDDPRLATMVGAPTR